ncbi:hypothetical protein NQ318_016887 [Aromia moschata]|uniref:SAP domain-containing protein n=1 Tax=Aromia moschata TaxID=1265417 RepID=A0AAV8XDG9_9CUCU|nr:hypothetical protein NQ318_016887 [Aromia moschata]
MASRQVFLKDLKVADLKGNLKNGSSRRQGKKADLQNRLKEALENEGGNPDIFLFEIAGDIHSALQSLKESLQQELQETSGNLREKKITENSSCLQKQIGEYVDGKFGEMENKLVTVEEEFQNKLLEMERKFATWVLEGGEQQRMINTTLKSPGSDIDRVSNPESSSRVEISRIRMKPPQFDGKSPWVNYLRQFEAAAKANGWSLAEKATALTLALRGDATDILQTLSLEEQEDYHQLVRHLEMRYGQSHLEHVYHSQLKNRYQKSNESLQEFEVDIARLVRLAYSSTPENVMERLAVQAFLDGLRDTETRQALTFARPSKLVDALARALEFEAAKQSCRGQAKVRRMEEGVEEGTCNEAEIRRVVEGMLEKRQIRPDIVGTSARITPTSWRLRTATGDPATIRGETNVKIVIGNVSFEHRALVAEIEDELILGMDIMNTKGFELDFKNNVLKINGEEIVLHRKAEETIRVVLAEDTAVPERSEMTLDAHLAGNPCVGNIMMFEPRSHDGEVARGIAVGKALLLTEKTVPVRIMNLNHHPVNLRKGIVLGYCSAVSSVIRKTTAVNDDWQSEKVLRDQENDPNLKPIVNWKKEGRKPTWEEVSRYSPTVKSYWAQWNSLVLSDGLLKRVLEKSDGTEERKQLIVPRNRVPEVLEEIHNGSTGGHLGVTKTLGKKLPRGKPRVVHFNRLAPFAGNNDEQAEARVRHVSPPDGELSFEEFMSPHSSGQKARYGVTREEPRDLFQVPADFCLAHCVAADLRMSRGIALTFKKAFGQLEELRRQRPEVGRVLQTTVAEQEKERSVFYLVTKQLSHHKPTYGLCLAIPKIASGLDGLDWRVIRSMLEVLFRFTGIEILVCCYNPRRSLNEKTVDCFDTDQRTIQFETKCL